MSDEKDLLEKLGKLKWHVKQLSSQEWERRAVCNLANHIASPLDTHYIMAAHEIMFVGNLYSLKGFVNSKYKELYSE